MALMLSYALAVSLSCLLGTVQGIRDVAHAIAALTWLTLFQPDG